MDDFTGIIKPMPPACICALCNTTMQSFENCEVVSAHAVQMLVHVKCADRAKKDDDREDCFSDGCDEKAVE